MAVAKPVPVGARVVDSLPFSQGGTAAQAASLKASGVDAVTLYLGAAGPDLAKECLDAGLGVMGVTFGGAYDGKAAVAQMKALGLPAGTSCFLDLEGPATMTASVGDLIAKINTWADILAGAGYLPCLYVGVPQPFTSAELYGLRVVRYWRGQGRIVDRNGQLAEPSCGWCMTQMWPSVFWGGVYVDVDVVGHDYHSRAPMMAVA